MEDLRYAKTGDVLTSKGKSPKPPTLVGHLGKVPSWKTVDLFIGGSSLSGGIRTNWREIDVGGFDFSSNPVSSNVLLIPESGTFGINGGIDASSLEAENAGGGAGGLMDIIKGAAEIFTGAVAIPEWGATVFKGLKRLQFEGALEFKFNFGSAGLNSGFEEVVKPILALCLFFGVEAKGDFNGHLRAAAANIKSPYPTQAEFLAARVKGVVDSVGGLDFTDSAEDLAGNLAKANAAMQSALASGAKAVSTSSAYRNLYMSWGRFTLGPLTYKDIKYSFNMDELDTDGWPISGSFTVGGLESMRASTTQALVSPFVKGV